LCGPQPPSPGLESYAQDTRKEFDQLTQVWTNELQEQWLLRLYISLKLVVGSTFLLGSADHAIRRNLQIAVPYLTYYAIFNCMRAMLLTSPRTPWLGPRTIMAKHDATATAFQSELRLLMPETTVADRIDLVRRAKGGRELLSYRFPASGARGLGDQYVPTDIAEEFARTAAELAYFNSAMLNAIFEKRVEAGELSDNFVANPANMVDAWRNELKFGSVAPPSYHIDKQDRHHLARMTRGHSRPVPMTWLIGEGGIDDLLIAWKSDEDDDGFDPDEEWDRLLSLP
jgi:hypothetical protein